MYKGKYAILGLEKNHFTQNLHNLRNLKAQIPRKCPCAIIS
jgi:hypothetical protein